MINLIVGPKGSGKTKKMTDLINTAVEKCNGAVLCIRKGDASSVRIPLSKNNIRIIDTDDFKIKSYDELYGLIAGAVASNYDIKEIFIDGTLKIGGENMIWLEALICKLKDIVLKDKINLTMTISCEKGVFPEEFFSSILN